MKVFRQLLASLVLSLLSPRAEGWSSLPTPPTNGGKEISRKSFLVGAASGIVLGTTATIPGAAVAIDAPYEPPAGSLADKVVVITGGTAGLGLVSSSFSFLMTPSANYVNSRN